MVELKAAFNEKHEQIEPHVYQVLNISMKKFVVDVSRSYTSYLFAKSNEYVANNWRNICVKIEGRLLLTLLSNTSINSNLK